MTPPRLVLDTNVLVSALLFHSGRLSWLRGAWNSGRIRPLAGRETTAELIRVLGYPKFGLSDADRQDILEDYLPFCETVTVPDPPAAVPECRDPFDRPFLELALAGNADALVTGDADLQALADVFTVPILTPAGLKRQLPGNGYTGT
ncbi:MAG: putative toxin-antitoxin system toxin component, PIN family [Rhodospirillaceae bacterium]|nr:putative toxin-antitoxin system toxin component, PIN family [Rhodospirillaceae bacterium]MDE0615958.1 putative toxin-antitoxin system toxin component, PIN family [Rhodospirillaceae bacterium]